MDQDEAVRRFDAIDRKLGRLEGTVTTLDKDQAVMKAEMASNHQLLVEIKAGIFRLFWIVMTVVAAAAVKFVIDGGLSNAG